MLESFAEDRSEDVSLVLDERNFCQLSSERHLQLPK